MKNYRIFRIARVAYSNAFERLYSEQPALKSSSSKNQITTFFEKSLVYSDSFSREMTALGNEGFEIIYNAENIQKKWAEEHHIDFDEKDWRHEILCAQIETHRPDVLYIQGLTTNPEGFLPEHDFREKFPFIKLVVGFAGFAHPFTRLEGIDIVISGLPTLYESYKCNGVATQLVYHGFDDSLLTKLDRNCAGEPGRDGPRYDFTFVGTSGAGHGTTHKDRYWALVRLLLATGLEVWVDDNLQAGAPAAALVKGLARNISELSQSYPPKTMVELLRESFIDALGNDDPSIPLSMLFPERCNAPVYGIDMYNVMVNSRLSFNQHFGGSGYGNMRVFEATGVGSCLVTDAADSASNLFEADTEIVTYASLEECIEKINYLLDHEAERRTIAEAGQRRTLGEHTMRHRCAQIHDIISRAL